MQPILSKCLSILFPLLLAVPPTWGQPVNCEKDMGFIIETFRLNYAGYPSLVSRHGEKKVDSLISILKERSIGAESIRTCEKIVHDFVDFINDGHVYFGRHQQYKDTSDTGNGSDKPAKVDKNPSFEVINNHAVLLTVPSFKISFKDSIDTLIKTHHDAIISAELLIIDVRNNGGGSDASYEHLVPYFYTHPVVQHSAEFRASKDNIEYFQQLYNSGKLPENTKKQLGVIIDRMKSAQGDFALATEFRTDTLTLKVEYPKPEKVAFIFNEGSGSTTDQLLLTAEQSDKVTFFGTEPTGGPLDFSNLRRVTVPSGVWWITVPTSRSTRLPEHPYDPTGMEPDVQIPDKTADQVQYVLNYFSEQLGQ